VKNIRKTLVITAITGAFALAPIAQATAADDPPAPAPNPALGPALVTAIDHSQNEPPIKCGPGEVWVSHPDYPPTCVHISLPVPW
jgi:hypothetical protein